MSSFPSIPKSTVNYAKYRNINKQKLNQEGLNSVQNQIAEAKQILGDGNDFENLFEHMNKDNLSYIKSQIKQKQKKNQRAKSTNDESRKTFIEHNSSKKLSNGQLSLDQTHSFHHQTLQPNLFSNKYFKNSDQTQIQYNLKLKFFKQASISQQSEFLYFLDHYIESIDRNRIPRSNLKLQSHKTFNKNDKDKNKNLVEQIVRKKIASLQYKYGQQKKYNALLAKKLQDHKIMQQIDKQTIMKLQDQHIFLINEIHKYKFQQKQDQNNQIFKIKNLKFDYFDIQKPRNVNCKLEHFKERERMYAKKLSCRQSIKQLEEEYNEHLKTNAQIIKKNQNKIYRK